MPRSHIVETIIYMPLVVLTSIQMRVYPDNHTLGPDIMKFSLLLTSPSPSIQSRPQTRSWITTMELGRQLRRHTWRADGYVRQSHDPG